MSTPMYGRDDWLPNILLSDCLAVKAEPGKFFIKADDDQQGVCDLYLTAMPEQLIQVRFDEFDVACGEGGKVSVSNLFPVETSDRVN